MSIDMELIGAGPLARLLLTTLPKKIAQKAIKKALRKGAQQFKKHIRNNILTMVSSKAELTKGGKLKSGQVSKLKGSFAGRMRDAITVKVRKKQRSGEFGINALIDPKKNDEFVYFSKGSASDINTKKLTSGSRSYIPAAIEFGHDLVYFGHPTNKKVRPIPFFRRAWVEHSRPIRDFVIRILNDEIIKQTKLRFLGSS